MIALLSLAGSALLAAPAGAQVHRFRALHSRHAAVKRFRVVGIGASTIVRARLITRHGARRIPVARVRHAAHSRRHLLRARMKLSARVLTVTTAPETTITAGLEAGSETTSTSAQFDFTSSAPAKARYYCSLDGAAAARCSSGIVYGGLGLGGHRFTVYAVDRYGTPDPTPAERSWSVVAAAPAPSVADTTAPETTITSGPADGSSTISTSASFSFSGTDNVGVAAYECSLDGAAFAACSAPAAYSGLAAGAHSFAVRAVDAAGNVDPTPASRAWTITASGSVYTVPASVPAGCSSDATSQILSWLASVPDGATAAFSAGACYRIEGTLELKGRTLTIEGGGATFRSFNAPEDQRAIWRLWNSDVTLRNMSIVGSYAEGGVFDAALEHAHGIDLRGTHAAIENTSISDVGGDCVYFGLGATRSSGLVRESSCRAIGRNAVSVTAGEDIVVEHVSTDSVGYIAFDVEPNSSAGSGASGVAFDSNRIGSYGMKAYTVIGNAPVAEQAFSGNRVVGQGLKIGVADGAYRPRGLTISGNSTDTATAPVAMNLSGVEGLTVDANTVPLTGGTMIDVEASCGVSVSGNSYPGGSTEVSLTNSTAQC